MSGHEALREDWSDRGHEPQPLQWKSGVMSSLLSSPPPSMYRVIFYSVLPRPHNHVCFMNSLALDLFCCLCVRMCCSQHICWYNCNRPLFLNKLGLSYQSGSNSNKTPDCTKLRLCFIAYQFNVSFQRGWMCCCCFFLLHSFALMDPLESMWLSIQWSEWAFFCGAFNID